MECFLNFLNNNSGAIQAISVVILLFVTWWYANTSHKMAKIMKDDFNLRSRPFLSLDMNIERRFGNIDNGEIQLVFGLKNVGVVPIIYLNEKLELSGKDINPKKVEIVIFPQQTLILFSNPAIMPTIKGEAQNQTGEIKILFWTQSNINKKYFLERNFTLATQNATFINKDEFGEI